MVNWVDTIVVGIVILFGLVIFYKALREPIDAILSGIKNLFGWGKERVIGGGDNLRSEIYYG